jgi:hypothetical protein
METPRFRFSVQALVEVAVVIISVAIAYASNRHRLLTLEQRVTQHEILTQGYVPPAEIQRLSDRVQKLEREVAVLQSQISRYRGRSADPPKQRSVARLPKPETRGRIPLL